MDQLNQDQFREVLQLGTINPGNGTLFGVPTKRAANKKKLTLIISTGGSGKTAIQDALKIANEKLDVDYSLYTKFLVIDSATKELTPLEKQGIDTLNLSSPGFQQRLEPSNRSIFYKNMISKDFPVQHINEDGASRMRQIGRVKLYDDAEGSTNDQKLTDMIKGYFAKDWKNFPAKSVDIMILTGISGGNGSGTFLNIASIAKAACPNPGNVTVYGYIMLPDTAEGFANGDDAKRILHRNGYSALKELENFECMDNESVDRKETIQTRNGAIELNNLNKPYDYPVLISGNYDNAVSMIAETIVDTIADSDGAFDQQSFYSNNGTVRQQRRSAAYVSDGGVLQTGRCPEDSHMYCGIGYAFASIPEKVVIPHVIGNAAKRLYVPEDNPLVSNASAKVSFCTKDRALSKAEFENAMRDLLSLNPNEGLTTESLWRRILSKTNSCKAKENPVEITYDEVVDNQIGAYIKGFGTIACTNAAKTTMDEYLQQELDNLKERARGVMKKYGPRAMGYLYTGQGNPGEDGTPEDYSSISLKKQVENVKDKYIELSTKPGKMPAPLEPLGLFGKLGQKINGEQALLEWCQGVKNCQDQNIRCEVAKAMSGENGIWKTKYEKPLLEFLAYVERFADVLEKLSDYYAGEGKSLDSKDFRDFAENSGERNGINLCTNASMYAWVTDKIDVKQKSINVQDVRDALIDDFYKNTKDWVSNEEGKARTCYDEIMSKCCGVGKYGNANNAMNLSINDYFEHVLADIPDAQKQQEVTNTVSEIYDRLIAGSAPALTLKPNTKSEINKTILLPKNLETGTTGTMIKQAFNNLLAGSNNSQIAYSSVVDAIVCYQTSVGNALSSLNDLDVWERDYFKEIDNTTHSNNAEFPSLHMQTGSSQYNELTRDETAEELEERKAFEPLPFSVLQFGGAPKAEDLNRIYGTGLSWADYPSINVSAYGDDFSNSAKNGESTYRSDLFAKKVDEAIRIGLIEWENVGTVYKCYLNTIPSDWTDLKTKNYTTKDKQTKLFVRGKMLFDFLKTQNPSGTADYRKQIALRDPNFFGTQGFDLSVAMHQNRWTEDKASDIRKAYMMRILRKSTELYQLLEDSLYRFYAVEFDLENREQVAIAQSGYRNFFENFVNGVIKADEDLAGWDVLTTADGVSEEIVTFSRRALRGFEQKDQNLYAAGFRMLLVYQRFQDLKRELELDDKKLSKIQSDLANKLSDREFDKMIDGNLEVMEAEYAKYQAIVGKSRDTLDALMTHFEAADDEEDEYQVIDDFYQALGDEIEHQKSF